MKSDEINELAAALVAAQAEFLGERRVSFWRLMSHVEIDERGCWLCDNGAPQAWVARMMKISPMAVSRAVRRESWK